MSSQFSKLFFIEFDGGPELEHASGVHDILRRRAPVDVGRRLSANGFAYLLNQRNDRKTRTNRSFGQRLEIDFVWMGRTRNLVRCCSVNDADTRFSARQGGLHFY